MDVPKDPPLLAEGRFFKTDRIPSLRGSSLIEYSLKPELPDGVVAGCGWAVVGFWKVGLLGVVGWLGVAIGAGLSVVLIFAGGALLVRSDLSRSARLPLRRVELVVEGAGTDFCVVESLVELDGTRRDDGCEVS